MTGREILFRDVFTLLKLLRECFGFFSFLCDNGCINTVSFVRLTQV